MKDPKVLREFTDFSDYPQNGFGDIDLDREPIEEEPEEDIENENNCDE